MAETDPGRDLRESPRRPFTVDLKVTWQGGEFSCSTVDISLAGLFIETEEPIPVGSSIRFEGMMEVAGDRWHLAGLGEVTRGVRIGDLDPDTPIPGLGVRTQEIYLGEGALTDALDEAAAEIRASVAERGARRSPRILVGVPVRWGPTWPPDRDGYLSNVSSSGALVLTADEPLEPGAAIHLSVELPTGREFSPLRTLATVARRAEPTAIEGHGMGIEFVAETDVERVFRKAVAGGDGVSAPSPSLPGSMGGPAMDLSSMTARVEAPDPSVLEVLSQTVHRAGGFRWGTVLRILGLGLLLGAFLWLGFVCMDSFSAGTSG